MQGPGGSWSWVGVVCAVVSTPWAAGENHVGSVARRVNLTVYRVTPKNITGDITNLNTGDVGGDGFFSTYEMMFPLYCEQEPTDDSCRARNKLNIPNNNVYEQSIVEVDPRFGCYNGCIPNVTVKDASVCQPYTNTSQCWWEQQGPGGNNFSDTFKTLCSKSQCQCEAVLKESVGAYKDPMGQFPVFWHNQTAMWKQIEKISQIWDGWWYSTLSQGECIGDQVPGTGKCFWKYHGVQRRVNATCVKRHLADAVSAHNRKCFDALPNPSNVTDVNWSKCLITGITGMDYMEVKANGPTMTKKVLWDAFLSGFKPESQGGCDSVGVM